MLRKHYKAGHDSSDQRTQSDAKEDELSVCNKTDHRQDGENGVMLHSCLISGGANDGVDEECCSNCEQDANDRPATVEDLNHVKVAVYIVDHIFTGVEVCNSKSALGCTKNNRSILGKRPAARHIYARTGVRNGVLGRTVVANDRACICGVDATHD